MRVQIDEKLGAKNGLAGEVLLATGARSSEKYSCLDSGCACFCGNKFFRMAEARASFEIHLSGWLVFKPSEKIGAESRLQERFCW